MHMHTSPCTRRCTCTHLELGLAVASRELPASLPQNYQPTAHVTELGHDLGVRPAAHQLRLIVDAQLLVHLARRAHHVLALHLALGDLLLVLDGVEGLRVLVGPRAAIRARAATYQPDDRHEARPCESFVGHVHWDDLGAAYAAAARLLVEVIAHASEVIQRVVDEVIDRLHQALLQREALLQAINDSHSLLLLATLLLGRLLGRLLLRLPLLVLRHRAAGHGHGLAALEHASRLEPYHLAVQHRLLLPEARQRRLELRDLRRLELRRRRRRWRGDGLATEDALLLLGRCWRRGAALDERVAPFQRADAAFEKLSEGAGQRVGRDGEGLLEGWSALLSKRRPQVLRQLEVDHSNLVVVQRDVVVPYLHMHCPVAAQRGGAHLDRLPLRVEILGDHLRLAQQVEEAVAIARLEHEVRVARVLREDVAVEGWQPAGA